jgi:hypothetical protein
MKDCGFEVGFEVGDEVIITRSGRNWSENMNSCVGMIVTIKSLEVRSNGKLYAKFKEEEKNYTLKGYNWVWEDGHFLFHKRAKKKTIKLKLKF